MLLHAVRPNAAKTHCLDCGRAIVKGERRPSGLYWRHVKVTETIDVRPTPRCHWMEVDQGPCARPATHGTLIRETLYYLCKYHAGKAKRDGWRGVKTLKSGPAHA